MLKFKDLESWSEFMCEFIADYYRKHPHVFFGALPIPFKDFMNYIINKLDNNFFIVIANCGQHGAGKSNTALVLSYIYCKLRNLDFKKALKKDPLTYFTVTPQQAIHALTYAKPKMPIVLDEAGSQLYKREAQTKFSKDIIKLFQQIRAKNNLVFLNGRDFSQYDVEIRANYIDIVFYNFCVQDDRGNVVRGLVKVFYRKDFANFVWYKGTGEERRIDYMLSPCSHFFVVPPMELLDEQLANARDNLKLFQIRYLDFDYDMRDALMRKVSKYLFEPMKVFEEVLNQNQTPSFVTIYQKGKKILVPFDEYMKMEEEKAKKKSKKL